MFERYPGAYCPRHARGSQEHRASFGGDGGHGQVLTESGNHGRFVDENSTKGWKTVRVFVSSTFTDMHSEREILIKKVISNSF